MFLYSKKYIISMWYLVGKRLNIWQGSLITLWKCLLDSPFVIQQTTRFHCAVHNPPSWSVSFLICLTRTSTTRTKFICINVAQYTTVWQINCLKIVFIITDISFIRWKLEERFQLGLFLFYSLNCIGALQRTILCDCHASFEMYDKIWYNNNVIGWIWYSYKMNVIKIKTEPCSLNLVIFFHAKRTWLFTKLFTLCYEVHT